MLKLKSSLWGATAALMLASASSAFAAGSVNTATVATITPPVQTFGAGGSTDLSIGSIDDTNLPAGFPGQTAVPGHSFSEVFQAVESDGSGANAVVNGEGDLTLNAFDDGAVHNSQFNIAGTSITATTTTATLTTTGGTTINGGVSVTGGFNNNNGGITNIGALSGITSLSISGVANLSGGISTSTITTSGLATLNSLAVVNNATVGGTFGVTGATTLSGGATIIGGAGKSLLVNASGTTANGGAALWSGVGVGNSVIVDGTSARLVDSSGANNMTVGASGVGARGNGAALTLNGVTGSLTNSNGRGLTTSATTTTLTGGANGGNASTLTLSASSANLLTQDGSGLTATQAGAVGLTGAKGTGTQRSAVSLSASGSDVSLLNNTGHGMATTANATTLSGGTSSTSLLLNDSGATFGNSTGGPAKVTGVANGASTFDAVNFGQLKDLQRRMAGGTAMASALAGMPQVDPGKTWGLSIGGGYFDGQGAGAFGMSFRDGHDTVFKLGVAAGGPSVNATVSGGVGFSW